MMEAIIKHLISELDSLVCGFCAFYPCMTCQVLIIIKHRISSIVFNVTIEPQAIGIFSNASVARIVSVAATFPYNRFDRFGMSVSDDPNDHIETRLNSDTN